MSLTVRFETEAAAEVEDAAAWYDLQGKGLGSAFLAAVDRAVGHVTAWPDAGALVEGLVDDVPVRRAPVTGFPYYLAYLPTPDAVRVLAVVHARRRPDYWHSRASDPLPTSDESRGD